MSPTSRFHLAPAPDGLGRVQDLLNTRAIGVYDFPDLLADGATASKALHVELSDADAGQLRDLRHVVEELIAGIAPSPVSVAASLEPDDAGVVQLRPSGRGWKYVASEIWSEILLAQRADTWRRLKRCKNELCGSAFYDRSRNNSGVWHDVKTCGNQANLRASRARRKSE
ncbi:CGNR zinc finger domain-containing protein [Rhodococcus sp. P1Y]|uniref:CGNR zinc finger domain-containing protein n=1 Tax=Rhodococcus sp. P1Y TaxID=1302308 RepID=UPI000EB39AAA|nr:CGNR zinc finger domain-containing protein [Rhodococcus sp. P1Y]AYJ47067.1 CGNR zinc finger domain-containing protein [Rhodococcus sp. P1Y]